MLSSAFVMRDTGFACFNIYACLHVFFRLLDSCLRLTYRARPLLLKKKKELLSNSPFDGIV